MVIFCGKLYAICEKCNSYVEINERDIKFNIDMNVVDRYITCHVCNHNIPAKHWRVKNVCVL